MKEKRQKWKKKDGNWQARIVSPSGELKNFDCLAAYHLHKNYARLLVEVAKNGGATLVAERMPNRQ